jgi:hypothetical protein
MTSNLIRATVHMDITPSAVTDTSMSMSTSMGTSTSMCMVTTRRRRTVLIIAGSAL